MARISGTTALRAALGGVAGGLKGLGAMREEQRLLAQQEEARKRQADLDQLGLLRERFTPVSQIEPTRQAGGDALSRALSSATAMLAPGSMMAGRMPSLQAGDTGRIAQGRASTAPQQRVKFGGVEYTRETPESYEANKAQTESMLELEKLGKQQDLIAERNKAANERANRGYFAVLQRAKALPEGVTYEDMQDIDLKPFFDEYKQAKSAEDAMQRANVMARAQRGMVGSFQTGIDPATGQPTIIGFTRGGEVVPTGVQSPQQLGKGSSVERRNIADLQASITELDKAMQAVKSDPTAFGMQTVLPNVALSRQPGVKTRADVTRAIVKLRRTEFGTAQSKSERESGVSLFPDKGDEAQAVLDKLQSLKEKAEIELAAKQSAFGLTDSTAAPPVAPAARPAFARPAVSPVAPATPVNDEDAAKRWILANPKRQNETDAQYKARYQASVRGGV